MTAIWGNTAGDIAKGQRHWSHDPDDVVALILAAGSGSRLAPLTFELPKPLCPVRGQPLLEVALRRLEESGLDEIADVVVNVHHGAASIISHLGMSPTPEAEEDRRWTMVGLLDRSGAGPGVPAVGVQVRGQRRLWVSHERERALGTAGAIANIRPWLDGRGVLALNADTWTSASLASLVAGWDGVTARVLVVGDTFGPAARVAGALVPWVDVLTLPDTPSGLYEHCWAGHAQSGNLEVITSDAHFVDCGSPADYLRANLAATAGASSVDPTATVRGTITRCVVWPQAHVEVGEVLTDAIRTTSGRTVLIRAT